MEDEVFGQSWNHEVRILKNGIKIHDTGIRDTRLASTGSEFDLQKTHELQQYIVCIYIYVHIYIPEDPWTLSNMQ